MAPSSGKRLLKISGTLLASSGIFAGSLAALKWSGFPLTESHKSVNTYLEWIEGAVHSRIDCLTNKFEVVCKSNVDIYSKRQWFYQTPFPKSFIWLANSDNNNLHNFGLSMLASMRLELANATDAESMIDLCNRKIMVALARSKGISSSWFTAKTIKDELSSVETLAQHLYDALISLDRSSADPCTIWLIENATDTVESRAPVKPQETVSFWSFVDNIEPHPQPERKENKIEQRLLRYLTALEKYSQAPSKSNDVIKLLPTLINITNSYPKNFTLLLPCVDIVSNIARSDNDKDAIFESGFIEKAFKWTQCEDLSLSSASHRLLENMDSVMDKKGHFLEDGVYVLHPTSRNVPIKYDIVFLHGLRGSPFRTWRQGKERNIQNDDQPISTYCWPKCWLSQDIPLGRIICLKYDTGLSDWKETCPFSKQSRTIVQRSADIESKLLAMGIGERPIIWVTHSFGGIIVKQILIDSFASGTARCLYEQTRGVAFYSVPHRGTMGAKISVKGRFLLFPSVEVSELRKGNKVLQEIHERFLEIVDHHSIRCLTYNELQPVTIPYLRIKTIIVPKDSSELERGVQIDIDGNHVDTCKPINKQDPRYKDLLKFVKVSLSEDAK